MAWSVTEGDIFSLNVDARQNGQQILLTHHYQITNISGGTLDGETFESALATKMDGIGGIGDAYLDIANVTLVEARYIIQRIYPTRMVPFFQDCAFTTGQTEGEALPQNSAAVIVLRSDVSGASQRSIKHIGAMTADPELINAGLIMPDLKVKLDGLANIMIAEQSVEADVSVVTLRPIIFHRATPNAPTALTNYKLENTVRVMRRRTVRIGS